MIDIRRIEHGTPEYLGEVELRRQILRIPLGLDFDQADLDREARDIHVGAFWGEELVGCLVLTPLEEGAIKMRQVAVRPELQGKGIGAMMVAFSETESALLGFSFMVLSARDTAVPFYLKLGYAIEGEPFEEVTIPHRKMLKKLSS